MYTPSFHAVSYMGQAPKTLEMRPPMSRASSSASSVALGDYEMDAITMEGLSHSNVKLEAR
jgi:hypothetical protein